MPHFKAVEQIFVVKWKEVKIIMPLPKRGFSSQPCNNQ